jgi:hypothetical protein
MRRLALLGAVAGSLIVLTTASNAFGGSAPGTVRLLCWTPYYSDPPKIRVYTKIKSAKQVNVTWRGRTLRAEHSGNVWGAYFSVARSTFKQVKRSGSVGRVKLGAKLRSGRHVHRSQSDVRQCVFL